MPRQQAPSSYKCTASLGEVIFKAATVHTVTYFIFGFIAYSLFDYATRFATPEMSVLMRPTTDPVVIAGTLFQPIRGALFGIVFFLLRDILFAPRNGWFITWVMLVIVGILSPFGPSPGSIEGAIFLSLPWEFQFNTALIEVYGQSLALALGTYYWVRLPHNRLMGWGFLSAGVLVILLTLAGVFLSPLAQGT